jgi:phenylpropionate dioxygenase-like ring-hydroxylating dioxygenase large terminal subunit
MKALERCWHPAAWSHELGRSPRGTQVLGRKVVAFRDKDGKAAVLEDRCSHRGVMLSRGKVHDGCIRCPYHGWEFDAEGQCTRIPSLLPEHRIPKGASISSYPVREEGGMVWFCFSEEPLFSDPPQWHCREDKHFFTATIDIRAGYVRVMENLVDNPHAGFLHAGLLRSSPTTPVVAHVRRLPSGVHIQTDGEKAQDSILARAFGRKGQEFKHTEEYEHPYVIKTFFQRDVGRHISSQFLCVPVDEHTTRWYCRLTLSYSYARFAMPLFKRVVLRILLQDRDILEERELYVRNGDLGKSVSTQADVPSLLVVRAATEFAQRGPLGAFAGHEQPKEALYRL